MMMHSISRLTRVAGSLKHTLIVSADQPSLACEKLRELKRPTLLVTGERSPAVLCFASIRPLYESRRRGAQRSLNKDVSDDVDTKLARLGQRPIVGHRRSSQGSSQAATILPAHTGGLPPPVPCSRWSAAGAVPDGDCFANVLNGTRAT